MADQSAAAEVAVADVDDIGPIVDADGPRRYPHPSSAARSANMRGNRRADTKPELALRRALHGRGYRYRKDYRLDLADGIRVRPDIVFTARRVAVFVDGCFWHCCPEHGSRPAANTWYWEPKLRRNVERDRAADTALGQAGWTVVRLWEHESLEAAIAAVVAVLARGDDPPEPPAMLARGDDPPNPPAVLAWGDDPPEPPGSAGRGDDRSADSPPGGR